MLPCAKKLAVVQGATHLFEEPGALQEVASLGANWFEEHLSGFTGNRIGHHNLGSRA